MARALSAFVTLHASTVTLHASNSWRPTAVEPVNATSAVMSLGISWLEASAPATFRADWLIGKFHGENAGPVRSVGGERCSARRERSGSRVHTRGLIRVPLEEFGAANDLELGLGVRLAVFERVKRAARGAMRGRDTPSPRSTSVRGAATSVEGRSASSIEPIRQASALIGVGRRVPRRWSWGSPWDRSRCPDGAGAELGRAAWHRRSEQGTCPQCWVGDALNR